MSSSTAAVVAVVATTSARNLYSSAWLFLSMMLSKKNAPPERGRVEEKMLRAQR